MEEQKDNINPDYYKNQTSLECIEAMEIIFGRDAVIDFCKCNAWKYIWRWKNKNGNVDLEKANWYLERAYEMLDGNDKRLDMVKNMVHYIRLKMEEYNEKYSDWKDAPWLNQKILEESKRIKGEESDG